MAETKPAEDAALHRSTREAKKTLHVRVLASDFRFYGQRLIKECSSQDASAKRDLIRIFEIAANWNATGDDTDFQGKVLDPLVYVKGRGVALHRGTERKNDFPDLRLAAGQAGDERLNAQVCRPNAMDRRYYSAQHVIQPAILRGVFDRHDIAGIFHDADDRPLPSMAGTNRTNIRVGNVKAGFAIPDTGSQLVQGVGKRECIFLPVFNEMQHQSQSGFFSDAGKLRDLIDSLFNKFGRKIHVRIGYKMRASMPASQMPSRNGLRNSKVPVFTVHLPV